MKILRNEKAASVGEFGIIVGLVSVLAIVAVFASGQQVKDVFTGADTLLQDPAASGLTSASSDAPPPPPPFDPSAYGLDMTGWLMGTPEVDDLTLAGEPGVMALESSDTITGDSAGTIMIGAPGDDVFTDSNGDDTYYYRPGDGSDTITEYYSGYNQAGQNTFIFQEFSSDDVTLGLGASADDATITLNDGSLITLIKGATGSYRDGINTFTFDDVTWSRRDFRDRLVEDQKPTGTVIGSTAPETYRHRLSDGSYTLLDDNRYDFEKGDRFIFEDINADDVIFSRNGDDVVVTMNDGDFVSFLNSRNDYSNMIPTFEFADTTMSRRQFSTRLVEDLEDTGTVEGSVFPEDYVYELGEGSFSVRDYNQYDFQKGDTFTFQDLAMDDVVLSLDPDVSGNFRATFSDGAIVTFVSARSGANYMIPTWIFSDGTLTRSGMYSKLTDDQKASGAVVGTSNPEYYVHEDGDGSYTVSDYNQYDWQKADSFTFIGFNVADATLVPSGDDFEARLNNGETVTFLGARAGSNRMIPNWNFDDATFNRRDMYSKLVNDQKSTGTVLGTVYAEDYVFQSGDGSFTVTDSNSYDWQKADLFTFLGFNQDDVDLTRVGNNFVFTVNDGGTPSTVTIINGASQSRYLFPNWSFADGSMNRQGIWNKSVRDQKLAATGTVRGTIYAEQYEHAEGDGSYTITDNHTSYDWQQGDTFTFTDLNSTDVTISNDSGDMVLTTVGGDVIRFPSGASNGRYRVNQIIFNDGVVYNQATQASFL